MTCTPIRMAADNHVPLAQLAATPAPVTPLDWLKNEWKARRVKWVNPVAEPIVITGTLPEPQAADVFVLPGHNLTGFAYLKLELFSEANLQGEASYPGELTPLADLIPLGLWRAGIDPYGMPSPEDIPSVFVLWLPEIVLYQSWRLTIEHVADADIADVQLRMLMLGLSTRLENNFSWDSDIRFLSEPDLVETASGSVLERRRQRESRTLGLSLEHMTDGDRLLLAKLEKSLKGRPLFISAYPAATGWQLNDYSFMARFANTLGYAHVGTNWHATNNIVLREA